MIICFKDLELWFLQRSNRISFYQNKLVPDLLKKIHRYGGNILVDTNLFVYVTPVCIGINNYAKNTEVLF